MKNYKTVERKSQSGLFPHAIFNICAETEHKIFNSAIGLFTSKSFNNVSFKDIANNVGIGQSTVRNHFTTRHT